MEAELLLQTGFPAQIPYRDFNLGWDDWPMSYTPMYAMYHGAYGYTLETPYRDERGVDAQYAAVWGALKYVAENKKRMIHDQVEIFLRGYLDLLQQPIPPELLPAYPQYEDLMIQEFPAAYVIPADSSFQISPHQPARLIDFLLFNDVQVEKSSQSFDLDGLVYPKGTYLVWLDQPKRGLANVILGDGLDLSDIPGLYFYSPPSVWSHPRLWGVNLALMKDKLSIKTNSVNKADEPKGSVEGGKAGAYAYLPTSIASIKASNELLARGKSLYRCPIKFGDSGRDFGAGAIIIPADPALAKELSSKYAMELFSIEKIPEDAKRMYQQRIAVYGNEGVRHSLKTLGFEYNTVTASSLNAGAISGYDVFINKGLRWTDLNQEGQDSFSSWFASGGNYIGLCDRGRAIDFAASAGWVNVDYGYTDGNAIVKIDFDPDDSVSAGFPEQGYAFVYRSVWFTDWNDMEVSARIDGGDFLVSGFWENWQTSGAQGKPVIVHKANGTAHVTLIGIDNTFRGHPEETFRILGNAIYTGID